VVIKILGWFSITLAVLALAPSIVPGAMSVLAYYLSLVALIFSIWTIKSGGVYYFKTTATIVCVGMFIFNDYLRLYSSLPQATWAEKLGLYTFYILIGVVGLTRVKKHSKQ
jgi:hypothetical protein